MYLLELKADILYTKTKSVQYEEGYRLRQLLNQTLLSHSQYFLEVRCYKISIPNKSSREHDFHTISAIGLLKSHVLLAV